MKVKYIARYEVGYRPRSRWEEKTFDTKWEATKCVEENQKRYFGNGGCVDEKIELTPHEIADRERSDRAVANYYEKHVLHCSRAF